MATINMRIFRTVLVLVVVVVIVRGQPLSNSGVQDDKDPPKLQKPADLEKISSLKESAEMEPKPEVSTPNLKPEIPSSDLKSELESAPPSATPEPQNPCSSVDQNCESKPGNYFDQRHIDYDQRQNGSENYRIQVDGLVLVLAPVEALLLAGGLGSEVNGQFNLTSAPDQANLKTDDDQSSNISSNPELEKSSQPVQRPTFYTVPKPAEGPISIKLINLIAPLLEQRRH